MPPYDKPVHQVALAEHEPLSQLLEKEELSVNSYHHQAIRALSPQLRAMAYSEDGLIEAVYAPGYRWVWALQWHPEVSFRSDSSSRKLFHAFVQAART